MTRGSDQQRTVGKRHTRQRQAIQAAIRRAAGPLSVEEIHDRARAEVEGLGIATVYRTIKLLLETETIHAVHLPDGTSRYESVGLGHHHHFRCTACRLVFDLDQCPLSITEPTTLPDGFRVTGHELTLFGLCPECGPEAGA